MRRCLRINLRYFEHAVPNVTHNIVLQKEAAWVLGNIAAGGHSLTRAVTDAGAVAPLAHLFNSGDLSVQKIAARGLANIGALPAGRDEVLAHGVITPLLA